MEYLNAGLRKYRKSNLVKDNFTFFLRRFTKPIEAMSEDIYFNSFYSDC